MWRLSIILLLNIILSTLLLPDESFAAEIIPLKNNTVGTDGSHPSNEVEVANKDNLNVAFKSTRHPDGREGVSRSYTEGGSVNVNESVNKTVKVSSDSASKLNDTLIVSLLNDTHTSANSSIHARKGVGNGTQSPEENKTKEEIIPVVQQKTDSTAPDVAKTVAPIHQENKTIPEKLKKPTVTSGSDDQFIPSHFNVPLVQPSSKPVITTTIDTANKAVINSEEPHESESKSQIDYAGEVISVERTGKGYMNPLVDSHPGFIIPVVITILVVPMFGLLGYLALRRGREAWKNRHYRRMDFLLDGMYND